MKTNYQNEINQFCDANNTLTAEDIMQAAQNNVITFEKPARKKNFFTKMNIVGRVAVVVAAFLVISSSTAMAAGAAGYGPFAAIFHNELEDQVSSEIVDKGLFLEVNESITYDKFDVTFLGLTGDMANPVLLLTIRVNDPEFVEAYDSFEVTYYGGLNETLYDTMRTDLVGLDNPLGSYIYDEAVAKRSKEDPSVYIVSAKGCAMYIASGERFVVALRSIFTAPDDLDSQIMTPGVEFRLSVENNSEVMDSITRIWFSEENPYHDPNETTQHVKDIPLLYTTNGLEFFPQYFELGHYTGTYYFKLRYMGTDFANGEEQYAALALQLDEEWNTFVREAKLVVDSKEYNATIGSGVWCDEAGEVGEINLCNVGMEFPAFLPSEVQHAEIVFSNGYTIVLVEDGVVIGTTIE